MLRSPASSGGVFGGQNREILRAGGLGAVPAGIGRCRFRGGWPLASCGRTLVGTRGGKLVGVETKMPRFAGVFDIDNGQSLVGISSSSCRARA